MFTETELNALLKPQVVNLAKYYGLDVNSRMLKSGIIEKILEYQRQPKEEESLMSARVKRIKEQNRS